MMTVDLHGLRASDARKELMSTLDTVVATGVRQLCVNHGRGGGVLRQITYEVLESYKSGGRFRLVKFRPGDSSEGGEGVTIATFK